MTCVPRAPQILTSLVQTSLFRLYLAFFYSPRGVAGPCFCTAQCEGHADVVPPLKDATFRVMADRARAGAEADRTGLWNPGGGGRPLQV